MYLSLESRAEFMLREMVCSRVPLCNKPSNKHCIMVSAEQSKEQSTAARGNRERCVEIRGRKRWHLPDECARAARLCVVWCIVKQCCSNDDLLLQQRFAP